MRVAVTGASGYLGRLAIPALLARSEITELVGYDRAPAPAEAPSWGPRYRHELVDLAQLDTQAWMAKLEGTEGLVHLAFEVAPPPGRDVRATNWTGQAALMAAAMAQPRRVLVASAIAAYGFGHAMDPATGTLDESAALRAPTGVAYADAKQALEALLDRLEPESPATLVRMRPTNVVGPSGDMKRSKPLLEPMMWAPSVSHPLRQQFLHEEDWARAISLLWTAPAGCYNVGPDDWILVDDIARLLGQRLMTLPPWALRPMAEAAYRTGMSAYGSDWLAFVEHPPIIVRSDKLKALGWAPRFSSQEALMLTVGGLKARLALS